MKLIVRGSTVYIEEKNYAVYKQLHAALTFKDPDAYFKRKNMPANKAMFYTGEVSFINRYKFRVGILDKVLKALRVELLTTEPRRNLPRILLIVNLIS
jgi:hypothetical protein